MEWYIKVLKNYAVFEGRASRQEYWMFFLFNIIVAFCLGLFIGVLNAITKTDQTVLGNIYNLAVLVPSIAVGIRRMHDTNRNGWWQIVPIAGLIFAIEDSQTGPNKYGPDPKGRKA
jgi:uncharacterized membrane protein YhaH (DUF805 family)